MDYSSGKFSEQEFQERLNKALDIERKIIKQEVKYTTVIKKKKKEAPTLFNLINKIKDNWNRFSSVEHLTHFIENYFIPKILSILSYFNFDVSTIKLAGNIVIDADKIRSYEIPDSGLGESETGEEYLIFKQYLENYIKEIDSLLYQLIEYYKSITNKRNNLISEIIDNAFLKSKCKLHPKGSEFKSLSLSQKAIQIIRTIPGIDYVLVGARREIYVDELIEIMNYENISNVDELLENLREEFIKNNFIKE